MQLAALAGGAALAALLVWLLRRVPAEALAGFLRLCLALLGAAFVVLLVGAFSAGWWPAANDPGRLLLAQLGLSAALHLLLSRL